jgi:hypothetical protein
MKIKLGFCNLRDTWENQKVPVFQCDSGGGIPPGSNVIFMEKHFYLFGFWVCELKYKKKIK